MHLEHSLWSYEGEEAEYNKEPKNRSHLMLRPQKPQGPCSPIETDEAHGLDTGLSRGS